MQVPFGECSREELEELLRLLRLSRLSFEEDELQQLCVDVSNIRSLLSRVSKYRDFRVEPLYNVWDETLSPPQQVAERRITITWLPEDRLKDGMVRVPWRGG
ncbi:hypothetical protein ASAC_0465 [Acidilobus saccharovorans 345-15]|uniref:Uncharacterized protein n=1 Tax=Acidilobus saccharovorans (strain DSM 16705 / JCM 18335 / VKM B-2471 / 345-15) TaxID=666510 RepID=D9Q0N4_ACIS3|nr:hypothetical protein [Acidilobus saccharovorans]ADL18872.1 hypothetical protein ASAC_0465 [Acidilobus saccharovorans 345-15]